MVMVHFKKNMRTIEDTFKSADFLKPKVYNRYKLGTKEELKDNIRDYYTDNEYTVTELNSNNSDYSYIQVHYRTDDKKLTIYSIDGLFKIENMQKCIIKKDGIVEQMSKLFPTKSFFLFANFQIWINCFY